MSVLGIIIGIVFVCVAVYKGMNSVIASLIGGLFILFTSMGPLQESFGAVMGIMGNVLGAVAPLFILGGAMGVIYTDTGAAASLGRFLMIPFRKSTNRDVQIIGVLIVILVVRFFVSMSGIDNSAIMVTMAALIISLFKEFNLPSKFIVAIAAIGTSLGNLIPGAPLTIHIMCEMFIPGFDNRQHILLRGALMMIFVIGFIIICFLMIRSDIKKGGHYTEVNLELPDYDETKKQIPWFLTLVPIAVVVLVYNFMKYEAWLSLGIGLVTCIVLFFPYFEKPEGKTRMHTILGMAGKGAELIPLQVLFVMFPTLCMSVSSGWNNILDGLQSAGLSPIVILWLLAIVCVGFGGMAAVSIIGGLATTLFVGMTGIGIGVVCNWGLVVFDTLPQSPLLVMHNKWVNVTMKEAYPCIFWTTVVLTGAISVLAAALVYVGII